MNSFEAKKIQSEQEPPKTATEQLLESILYELQAINTRLTRIDENISGIATYGLRTQERR